MSRVDQTTRRGSLGVSDGDQEENGETYLSWGGFPGPEVRRHGRARALQGWRGVGTRCVYLVCGAVKI